MPGLFGIARSASAPDLRTAFEQVWAPARGRFESECVVEADERWAIGRSHLGVLQPGVQLGDGRAALQVLFHGDLTNEDELASTVERDAHPGDNGAASITAALYERFGAAFAARLDGAFSVAIVDRAKHRIVLVSDLLGSFPLYWTVADGCLVFASELRALLRHPGVRCALNPRAVADYLTFGFPLGVKTLAEGVDLVPPGTTLEFDWDTGRVSVNRYATIADAFAPWEGTQAAYIDTLQHEFSRAVGRALSGNHRFGLALSGGLDSRAILSAVNGGRDSLSTCTLGIKGCADEVIAERLARVSGCRHHRFFELDDSYLSGFLPTFTRMVSLTDGMYLSHGLTEMLALGFLSSTNITVLLRGHGGELAKASLAWPLHTDDRVHGFRHTSDLVPYLLTRANYITPGVELRHLFTEPWSECMRDVARTSLEASVAGVPLGPADLCSYLYLNEQHRRYTIPSIELFRQAVDVRLPFVDSRFLKVLFRGQAQWRDDTSIHRAMIAAGQPALLKIRDSNTGARVDTGPLAGLLLEKANSLFKRLNVPGYRHYHNFQKWMQEQLLASVESVLLDPVSLERGMLRRDGLQRLLDDTRHGKADHSYLLQVLLILEVWQRECE